jgi:hypothetical protein
MSAIRNEASKSGRIHRRRNFLMPSNGDNDGLLQDHNFINDYFGGSTGNRMRFIAKGGLTLRQERCDPCFLVIVGRKDSEGGRNHITERL